MKKIIQISSTAILLLFILMIGSGCDEWFCDGSNQEPQITISYQINGRTVSNVTSVKDGVNLGQIQGANGSYFNLPIDLNANTVTYIFSVNVGGVFVDEKLQINYKTKSALQDLDCGFRFSINNVTIGENSWGLNATDVSTISSEEFLITIQ